MDKFYRAMWVILLIMICSALIMWGHSNRENYAYGISGMAVEDPQNTVIEKQVYKYNKYKSIQEVDKELKEMGFDRVRE
ncbi:MAG: hypothetical protein QXK37_06045 [Candidatus Woesearchaeota archaeon]